MKTKTAFRMAFKGGPQGGETHLINYVGHRRPQANDLRVAVAGHPDYRDGTYLYRKVMGRRRYRFAGRLAG